jgi:predicted porin
MKKTITALAIAAAMTASAAHAVEFNVDDSTEFSVYGDFQFIYVDANDSNGDSAAALEDNGSTLGVAGEHMWDNGLTGYFKAEWEHNADEEKANGGINKGDQAYAGVRGGFGNIRIGSWDGIYKDSIADVIDAFEYESPSSAARTGEGNQIAYFSPDFGGLSFQLQTVIEGKGEGVDHDGDGQPDSASAYQGVVKYDAGRFAVQAGLDNRGLEDDADPTYGIAGSVDLAPVVLGAKFESQGESASGANDDATLYGVIGEYDYSMGSVIAEVQHIEPGDSNLDSRTEYQLNVNYSVADNLYVYAEGGWFDMENDAGDYAAVGTVYSF